MMADVNGVPVHIRIKEAFHNGFTWTRLTEAIINSLGVVNSAIRSELHRADDTNRLFMFDGTANKRVHGLDMAVVCDGDLVTDSGEVIWFGELGA